MSEEIIQVLEAPKKSKYQSQNAYHKKRYNEDPEYRAKKNEMVRRRNAERYANDSEYREKLKNAAKMRTKKIMEIYKENKEVFKSLGL